MIRASTGSDLRRVGTGRCSCPGPPPRGPARPVQLAREDVGDIGLDDDLAVEVRARVEVEIGMRVAGEAVDTGVRTAAIGIDGPLEGSCAAAGIRLSADFASTSWKVIPANSGVRTVRTSPRWRPVRGRTRHPGALDWPAIAYLAFEHTYE